MWTTPFANDAGIEVLRAPRDYAAVRQALAHAGYNGEKVVVLVPTDVQEIRAESLAGVDQLRRAGINVEMQEMELGAAARRRQNQAAPDKGGWNAFFGLVDRSLPNTNPYGNYAIRADGLVAGNIDEQRRICAELQLQLWQDLPYIPMGEYWQSTAYRKDLLDVQPGCFAVFYGVRRV